MVCKAFGQVSTRKMKLAQRLTAIIERQDDGLVAHCPEFDIRHFDKVAVKSPSTLYSWTVTVPGILAELESSVPLYFRLSGPPLAQSAGVSRRSFFRYLASKDDLLETVWPPPLPDASSAAKE